jgi:hypothetical protein
MINVVDKICRENENIILCSVPFFFFQEIMLKNTVEPEGPRMTSQYGTYELHAGYARLHARTRMHTPMRQGTLMHAYIHAQRNK